MDSRITRKHQRIINNYENVKKRHKKTLESKVLEIEKTISIFRNKQYNIKIFKKQ